jgi:hypothetical protein
MIAGLLKGCAAARAATDQFNAAQHQRNMALGVYVTRAKEPYYEAGYTDWRAMFQMEKVRAEIATIEAKLAVASKRMRVCQSCGFTREAYSEEVNLSPKTCGICCNERNA